MKQNKDVRLTMRLTPEQYESICARAETAQMTPSAYARAAAMRHKVTVVPGLKELTHELKAIGRNINQLTVLAHEGRVQVAREFAARAWPESEVVVATHVDAAHIHSHFVVNAVCFETGKMLRQHPDTLQKLRAISDELCAAHGLSVLPRQQKKASGMTAREYRSAVKGESWKLQLMGDIDASMKAARSREDFIRRMRQLGYAVRWENGRKYITYTTPHGKPCRDNKLHETKYLKENMWSYVKILHKIK